MELDEFLELWSQDHILRHSYRDKHKDQNILNELKILYTNIQNAGLAEGLSRDMAELLISAYTFGRMMGFAYGGIEGLTGAINPNNQTYARHFLQPRLIRSKQPH